MSSKNCHTFSIGSAASNSLVISIGGLPLERAAAAEAAEVVGHAVPLQRIGDAAGGHGQPATRGRPLLPQPPPHPPPPPPTNPSNLTTPPTPTIPASHTGLSHRELPRGPQLHQLGQDGHGDLLM